MHLRLPDNSPFRAGFGNGTGVGTGGGTSSTRTGVALLTLRCAALRIPFRESFKHAAAERSITETVWVEGERGGLRGVGEGCPREYVTAETVVSALEFIAAHLDEWRDAFRSVADLTRWVRDNEALVDANPAAWSAVELACLDLIGRENGEPVEQLLSLPTLAGSFVYTAVIGDGSEEMFRRMLDGYIEAGFAQFKVKLSGNLQQDRRKIAALTERGVTREKVRVDANNLWNNADDAIDHLASLNMIFSGIEEPVAAGRLDDCRKISVATGSRIILDESFCRIVQLKSLRADPRRWILNVRVSKLGGLIRTIGVLNEARVLGVDVIVGAQVGETSVLTRAGLTAAHAAGELLLAQEGAFGTHLLQRDVCEPPLMFAAGGILDTGAIDIGSAPGLGLNVVAQSALVV